MPEMQTLAAPPGFPPSTEPKTGLWPIAVCASFLVLLWLEVVNHLKSEWAINPQYSYGWSVPLLSLYLLWKSWSSRPIATPPSRRSLVIGLIISCAIVFFPIRFVAAANPDWRLLSWAFALVAVTTSLALIYLAGGGGWLRHFAFPFVFFLVAVPWPMQMEQAITQSLMRLVATINVTLFNLAAIPALQHGNVIEVSTGLIGIEEACSGVRSLQATLMISLMLGELYSFSVARRLILIVAGAFLAFFCNVVRTALLVWMGVKHGIHSIEGWHDPAGLTILFVCLFGLWSLSLLMRRGSNGTEPDIADPAHKPVSLYSPLFVGLTIWLLLAEAGVQIWYRAHQSPLTTTRWSVAWPESEKDYKSVAVAPEAENMLKYNEGGGATWQARDGHQWTVYFFRWLPGRTAALFVKNHRPDMCLPASGLTMKTDSGIRLLDVNGMKLPVRSYRFDDRGTPLHVYYCYWDARSSYESTAAAEQEDWTPGGRLQSALRGRRETGAQMLEVVVWGYNDDTTANEALHRQLAQIIKVG